MPAISNIVGSISGLYAGPEFRTEQFRRIYGSSGGPAIGANFIARIFPPPILNDNAVDRTREFQFLCDQVNIPDRKLDVYENYMHYGNMIQFPTNNSMGTLNARFLMRASWQERWFFEKWINSIISNGPETSSTQPWLTTKVSNSLKKIRRFTDVIFDSNDEGRIPILAGNGVPNNYHAAFYDDYVSTMDVMYFDPDGERRMQTSFVEVFPLSVSSISLDWSQGNAILAIDVEFAYYRYVMSIIDSTEIKSAVRFIRGLINSPNLGTAWNTVLGTGTRALGDANSNRILDGFKNYGDSTLREYANTASEFLSRTKNG